MSCKKFELELFESFGSETLSDELRVHLKTCLACKEIYDNLQLVSGSIGTDDLFYESDEVVAKRVEAVNDKIDQIELSKVVDITARWKAYVPMAAALFLVLGVGLIAKFAMQFNDTTQLADNQKTELMFAMLTDDDTQSITETEFSEFLDSYTTGYTNEDELNLLDDLSEEEYKYLEENLNMGEIL